MLGVLEAIQMQFRNPGNDGEDEEEAQQPRAVRDPCQPTQAIIDERDLNHIRPWCGAFARGKAKRKPRRTLCGAYSESWCARVRMDYAHITENVEAVVEEDGREQELCGQGREQPDHFCLAEEPVQVRAVIRGRAKGLA